MRTYETGDPDPYPLFVNRRVYQGSSGRVYPIPFIDRVEQEAHDRSWQAIHLENEWIRLMVLPELGGRIHIGYDKAADYDFFYRNNVIKPALVGLAGPWISGGVEFNWPQHHRPATYLPVCTRIEEGADGSVTVWCSDHDPFQRMRGTHGIRLYPDRAVVEVEVRLHNRTSSPQTFLWWANAAARVDDDYQAFFPTDVHYVADHARRAITAYPEADRPYYGYDYPAQHADGGDRLDRYSNIRVPTSYMVTGTEDDFFGGYDHARRAGFVHVADRHIAAGKKLWTWGNDPFGHAWDRQLTDADGPYIELMAGVYTDNQPDFSWLEPGETKAFSQAWFPYQQIGTVQQATLEAAVHLVVQGDQVAAGASVTRRRHGAEVTLTAKGKTLHSELVDLAPGRPWTWEGSAIGVLEPTEVTVEVVHGDELLIQWTPRPESSVQEPETARIPPLPSDVERSDELVNVGIHLQQYRHPTREALPYFEEALRRDPQDARALQALGGDALRRGLYPDAEDLLHRALATTTRDNANPRDGEVSYLLGQVLLRTGQLEAADTALAKAAWDRRWAGPSHVERSRIAALRGDRRTALDHARRALSATPDDSRAAVLQVVQLRALGNSDEEETVLAKLLEADPLDPTATYLQAGAETLTAFDGRTLLDIAGDLMRAGADEEALEVLDVAGSRPATAAGEVRPLAHYHRALLLERSGDTSAASAARTHAQTLPHSLCFPLGLDDHDVLVSALEHDPADLLAAELLATLLFDAQRGPEALELWRRVSASPGAGPVALRNTALATYSLEGDGPAALALYERAIAARPDPRLIHEADQLRARLEVPDAARIRELEAHLDAVLQRDDATIEYCLLLVGVGRLAEAERLLTTRRYAPWEGGEGRVLEAWESLHLALADVHEAKGDLHRALAAARTALRIPESLGEGRHPLADTRRLRGRLAELLEATGEEEGARRERELARVQEMVMPVHEDGSIDYFATSLPDLLLFPEQS